MGGRILFTSSTYAQAVSSDLGDALARLEATVTARHRRQIESAIQPGETFEQAEHRLQAEKEAREGAVVQLPLWAESVRAVPNSFLRSALFGSVAEDERQYINGEDFTALNGITVRYKGERLNQSDLDVWENVLHAVRQQKLGSKCRLRFSDLLKMTGKTDTGKNRDTLQVRIERLVANAVTVKQGQYTYIGSLIRFAAKDEETKEWVIELDEKLLPLFAADQFTQVQWAVRYALGKRQLAKWLHGFYSSHTQPYPIKIETLYKLCGSKTNDRSKFAQMLREALDAIAKAGEANGEPFSYKIHGKLVYVEHTAGRRQRKRFQPLKGTVPAGRKCRSCE